jgi:CheY-like chemotaxis protein
MDKVFIIEDNPLMSDLLKSLLTLEGYQVESNENHEDVYSALINYQPDFILLDVHLRLGNGKQMNGFELLDQIRSNEKTKHLKVILSSGMDYSQESDKKGADGYLQKPYLPEDLIKLMKELRVRRD